MYDDTARRRVENGARNATHFVVRIVVHAYIRIVHQATCTLAVLRNKSKAPSCGFAMSESSNILICLRDRVHGSCGSQWSGPSRSSDMARSAFA